MRVDVRLVVVAALLLMAVCLTVAFVRIARSIRAEHRARFSRIQRRLEEDAYSIVSRLFR